METFAYLSIALVHEKFLNSEATERSRQEEISYKQESEDFSKLAIDYKRNKAINYFPVVF